MRVMRANVSFSFFFVCHRDAPALLVENSLSRKEGYRRRHTCHGQEGNGKSLRKVKQDGCFFFCFSRLDALKEWEGRRDNQVQGQRLRIDGGFEDVVWNSSLLDWVWGLGALGLDSCWFQRLYLAFFCIDSTALDACLLSKRGLRKVKRVKRMSLFCVTHTCTITNI